ncbi:MAG: MFS transporter [Anaerolineae bacterium]|nr:MAG: MFS transporter [Anaerolineae bacterium]
MRAFVLVAVGQAISLIGSGMTQFAVIIWAWEITGQATSLALAGFFGFAPVVLVSPLAGALVDRWNRKLVMVLSDLAAGLATIALLLLYLTDALRIEHIYLLAAFVGVFQAFQWPAFSAAISVMLPKEQYARANGMLELARAGSGILAPVLAGMVIGLWGIAWVFAIDIVTFLFAIGALLLIHVPQPQRSVAGEQGRGSLWQETLYGFRYIWQRRSLFWLQMVFFFINLTATFGYAVMAAMILARTHNDTVTLGVVQSAGALGGVAGGLLMSIWGGPRRRIHGVLLGMVVASLGGTLLMGVGRNLTLWAAASFVGSASIPVLNGSNQAIWQAKVAPDVQGRVFAVRRLIAQITAPLAMLLAGPLADRVFEPAFSRPHPFAWLVGSGPGAGMGMMFVLAGLLGALVGAAGYLFPPVRNVESLLPDHA